MHLRPQPRSLLLLPLLFATLSSAAAHRRAVKNDFSDYPSGTQQCLNKASDDSHCTGDTVAQMNQCLCTNGGKFVTNAASCIASTRAGDLESTWEVLSLHCSDSNTPLTVSKAQWMAQQSSVTTSSTASRTTSKTATKSTMTTTSAGNTVTATVTTTPTPTPTSPPASDDSGSGLSGGAKIGVIAGSAAVGVAVLAAALFFFCRYRKRRSGAAYEEVHALGAQSPYNHISKGPVPFGSPDVGAHSSYQSTTVSDLESASNPRRSWHPSPDGQSVPWSPGAFEAVKRHPGLGLHQPPPDVHEMSTDGERPVSLAPSAPVEMPAISVTSPTVSPTSRYSGADWDSQLPEPQLPQEPRRYEPYRPAR